VPEAAAAERKEWPIMNDKFGFYGRVIIIFLPHLFVPLIIKIRLNQVQLDTSRLNGKWLMEKCRIQIDLWRMTREYHKTLFKNPF